MTYEESRELISILRCEFPLAFEGLSEDEIDSRAKTWQLRFREETQHRVKTALIGCMGRYGGKYGPSIGDVYRRLADTMLPDELKMSENEAVQLVRKALSNATFGFQKEYDRLPRVIRETLGNSICLQDWSKCSTNVLNSKVFPTFRHDFRELLENAKEDFMQGIEADIDDDPEDWNDDGDSQEFTIIVQ